MGYMAREYNSANYHRAPEAVNQSACLRLEKTWRLSDLLLTLSPLRIFLLHIRYKPLVLLIRDLRLPVVRHHPEADDQIEQNDEDHREKVGAYGPDPGSCTERKLKRTGGRAAAHAGETTETFSRLHDLGVLHVDQGRAVFGADVTMDAFLFIARHLERTEAARQTQERAIGAEVAAPDVFIEQGKAAEDDQEPERDLRHLGEELHHPHVHDFIIVLDIEQRHRPHGHDPDSDDKETHQDILERAQRDVGEPGDVESPVEDLFSGHPDILRHRTDRTDPPAEPFFHHQRDAQDRREHDEPRRMHGLDDAGQDEVFEVHQPADGQEGVHRGRPFDKGLARRFEVLNELVKTAADEQGKGKKEQLDRIAEETDIFSFSMHGFILSEQGRSLYDMRHRGSGVNAHSGDWDHHNPNHRKITIEYVRTLGY